MCNVGLSSSRIAFAQCRYCRMIRAVETFAKISHDTLLCADVKRVLGITVSVRPPPPDSNLTKAGCREDCGGGSGSSAETVAGEMTRPSLVK